MTTDEIKEEMRKLGLSQVALAEKLGITKDNLNRILSGKQPLTKVLANHIELLLAQPREATLLYKINLTEGTTAELLGDKACTCKDDYLQALEAVIRHNLALLVRNSVDNVDWTDEERKTLGIPKPGQPLPPGFIPANLHLTEEK